MAADVASPIPSSSRMDTGISGPTEQQKAVFEAERRVRLVC